MFATFTTSSITCHLLDYPAFDAAASFKGRGEEKLFLCLRNTVRIKFVMKHLWVRHDSSLFLSRTMKSGSRQFKDGLLAP